MKQKEHYTIAISGASGSGKSYLISKLKQKLNATSIHFGDYVESFSDESEDFQTWLEEGPDLNLWKTPRFTEDIKILLEGRSISPPNSTELQQSAKYILVEEPTGRERDEVAQFIDFVVFIDTPLEVCLANRIKSDIADFKYSENDNAHAFIDYLDEDLDNYLYYYWPIYQAVNQRVMDNCDFLIDGLKEIDVLADQVVEFIEEFAP